MVAWKRMAWVAWAAAITVAMGAVFAAAGAEDRADPKGRYAYEGRHGGEPYSFALTFEGHDAVYYSYVYRGAGTYKGTWSRNKGLVAVSVAAPDTTLTFSLKPQGDDLVVASPLNLMELAIETGAVFKKDTSKPTAPPLTAEDVSRRVLKLIGSIRGLDDLSPDNIERQTGLKVAFHNEDRQEYGFGGPVADAADWQYGINAYPYPSAARAETDTLLFAFNYQLHEPSHPDLAPVCAVDFDAYSADLKASGFSSTPRYSSHNRLDGWTFVRGNTVVRISIEGGGPPGRQCVKLLTISVWR